MREDKHEGAMITFQSLLRELADIDRLAQFPDPYYTCGQFSSYNRLSMTPDDPETWFANADKEQFIRIEENQGRQEYVIMDHQGPGCVTRIWATNHNQFYSILEEIDNRMGWIIRFYLDGETEPAIVADMVNLLNGRDFIPEPFSYTSLRSGNMYFPIPYAKMCKITLDKIPAYYSINYRSYPPGTPIETFTMGAFKNAVDFLSSTARALTHPPKAVGDTAALEATLEAGSRVTMTCPAGPAAIKALELTLAADHMESALRSAVLVIRFDGELTVWCPVGDFFGSGIGLNPFADFTREVTKDGKLSCRWVMPYKDQAEIVIINLGKQILGIQLTAVTQELEWNERSMYFHAGWRQEYPLPTNPLQDWNYVEIEGKGVYIGDTLSVMNPVPRWWGEGDEKVYVDGESFPSHFGSGTEDYYGYAWGGRSNDFFAKPFHAQVRCGQKTYGHNTLTRVRSLDAIPFKQRLKFDMEVWHWNREIEVAYAAAVYWYARPGTVSNREPCPEEASRQIPQPPPRVD
jgi:hypothetical protein